MCEGGAESRAPLLCKGPRECIIGTCPVHVPLAFGSALGWRGQSASQTANCGNALAACISEEYEEQYTEARVTGQTFRNASHLPLDAPPEPSPRALPAKRLEFVFMVSPSLYRENPNALCLSSLPAAMGSGTQGTNSA